MAPTREIVEVRSAQPTIEGAGVRLMRAFARADPRLDPFLLLDLFGSHDPQDYVAGFPWHPHRGIETVTYMLDGEVEHQDSLGSKGVIGPGEVQWMTAGSGIIHQEMPQRSARLRGLQLWVNLPASAKMTPPRYRGLSAQQIPEVSLADGAVARVIAGEMDGVRGPVEGLFAEAEYLDVKLPPRARLEQELAGGHTAFAFLFEGSARFGTGRELEANRLIVLGPGEAVGVTAGSSGARFLLISGAPLREPVAWGGPIVMNTPEELRQAFEEFRAGTFVKAQDAA